MLLWFKRSRTLDRSAVGIGSKLGASITFLAQLAISELQTGARRQALSEGEKGIASTASAAQVLAIGEELIAPGHF